MAELIGGGDGKGSEKPPEGTITIILRLVPTAQGLKLLIEHDPKLFADVVIDACLRAARAYERQALLIEWGAAQERDQKMRRELGRLRLG